MIFHLSPCEQNLPGEIRELRLYVVLTAPQLTECLASLCESTCRGEGGEDLVKIERLTLSDEPGGGLRYEEHEDQAE